MSKRKKSDKKVVRSFECTFWLNIGHEHCFVFTVIKVFFKISFVNINYNESLLHVNCHAFTFTRMTFDIHFPQARDGQI